MKGKILNIILTVFLYLVLVAVLIMLLATVVVFDFLFIFSDNGYYHFGITKIVFLVIWGIGLIVPMFFRKKIKRPWLLPIWMMVSTIITTAINYGVLYYF